MFPIKFQKIKCEDNMICTCGGSCNSLVKYYPKLKIKDKFLIRVELPDGQQYFVLLNSPKDYIEFLKDRDMLSDKYVPYEKIPELTPEGYSAKEIAYHEISYEQWPQKIFLDIDNSKIVTEKHILKTYLSIIESNISNMMIDIFYHMYIDQFKEMGWNPDMIKTCITISLCDSDIFKPGVHVMIKDFAIHQDDVVYFTTKLKEKIRKEKLEYINIDYEHMMSRGIKNLRLIGSHKCNDNRIKKLYESSDDMMDSFISCGYKYVLDPCKYSKETASKSISSSMIIPREVEKRCIELMTEDEKKTFSLYSMKNNFVNTRHNAGISFYCDKCERFHDNDNTLYFVVFEDRVDKRCVKYDSEHKKTE
jgi:hypothetical protein